MICLTHLTISTNKNKVMPKNSKRPLQGTDNILELQENGYKSTVSAISEIIDNSIQANSKNVEVVIVCNTSVKYNEIHEILIIDDGDGMDETVFDKALQMSSGTRSGARTGLGKYGQGLPNASISQTLRVEVYTRKNDKLLFNYIDLKEIYDSGEPFLPDVEEAKEIKIPIFQNGKIEPPAKGTIVRWVAPNRIRPKTAKTLKEHIEREAGRIFRYYIDGFKDGSSKYKTNISIKTFDYNGKNYELNKFNTINSITPFDPMFLMKKTQMNVLCPDSNHPTSELFNEPIKKTFEIEYNGDVVESTIEIKLSYAKKEERDRYGRNAGNAKLPFGKAYLKRNLSRNYANISIVRAGREIDAGDFGFINDVSDNRNRWWSAEILIDPVLDHIIGIDNKKQQASNVRFLDGEEIGDGDTHEVIRWISTYLDENITTVKKLINAQNATPKPGPGGEKPGLPGGGTSEPGDNPDPGTENNDEARKGLFEWIKQRYPALSDATISNSVDYALSIKDYHIFINQDLGDSQLYSYTVFGTKVLIEINYEHAFYKQFLHKYEDNVEDERLLRSFRLLIGSMVNAEIVNKTNDKSILKDRRNVRNRMAESLDDYITDLYSS